MCLRILGSLLRLGVGKTVDVVSRGWSWGGVLYNTLHDASVVLHQQKYSSYFRRRSKCRHTGGKANSISLSLSLLWCTWYAHHTEVKIAPVFIQQQSTAAVLLLLLPPCCCYYAGPPAVHKVHFKQEINTLQQYYCIYSCAAVYERYRVVGGRLASTAVYNLTGAPLPPKRLRQLVRAGPRSHSGSSCWWRQQCVKC